ncbi:zinc finger BED domain-containing protein RICESLEEPER 2, partial [Tanacetum coccineum]
LGFDDDFATKANKSLEGLYNMHYLKYGNPTQSTSAASSSRSISENSMTQLLNRLKENSNKQARNDRLTKIKGKSISRSIANGRDILSVQATSVASKSAFSTSGRMLSIRRTRLAPTSLEICMCLKDHLDATDRIQHTSNLENSIEFKEMILDEEVLANETLPLFDEEITPDEAASEARSNGSEYEIEITSD